MQPCYGQESGMISLSVNSSTAYAVEWSNGGNGLIAEDLPAGIIEVTIVCTEVRVKSKIKLVSRGDKAGIRDM